MVSRARGCPLATCHPAQVLATLRDALNEEAWGTDPTAGAYERFLLEGTDTFLRQQARCLTPP